MKIELTRKQTVAILRLLDDVIYEDGVRMSPDEAHVLHGVIVTPLQDELRAEFLANKKETHGTL